MSFDVEKYKPVSRKIILVELDVPVEGEGVDVLLNYEAGVWYTRLAPGVVLPEDDHGVFGYYDNQKIDDGLDIGSVIVKDVSYIRVKTLPELRIQEQSFFYDVDTTELYIHFDRWRKPVGYRSLDFITVGEVNGFCNLVDPLRGCYYDNIYFDPRIISVPSLSKKKDRLFYGLVSFGGGDINFSNSDGFFDTWRDKNIFNQAVRIFMGFEGDEREDMFQVFSGSVDSRSWDFSTFKIKVVDSRKKLSNPIPVNNLNTTDFPLLDDGDVDKFKPIIYGTVYGAEAICVNPTATAPTDYDFLIMDTEHHNMAEVHTVYIDEVVLDPGNWSANLANGTITIDRASYDDEDVTVDVTGVNISNSTSVVIDLLSSYASLEFIPTNFNTLEFERAVSRSRAVRLYIDKTTPLIKAIEQCCVASDTAFLIQDDGKMTMRYFHADREPNREIQKDEWIGDPDVKDNEDVFLSSCVIEYNKNEDSGDYYRHLNTDYEAEVLKKYKGLKSKEFPTILATKAGAIAKSESIMYFSKEIKEQVSRATKSQHIDLEIMDFIVGSPVERYSGTQRLGIYEIIGIDKDLNNFNIKFDFQFLDWYDAQTAPLVWGGVLWYQYLWLDRLYQVAGTLELTDIDTVFLHYLSGDLIRLKLSPGLVPDPGGVWSRKSNYPDNWNFSLSRFKGGALNLYEIEIGTVTFDSRGGSAVAEQIVKIGDKVIKPADPVYSSYGFGGWYKDSGFAESWNFAVDTVSGNVTLYAKWIEGGILWGEYLWGHKIYQIAEGI